MLDPYNIPYFDIDDTDNDGDADEFNVDDLASYFDTVRTVRGHAPKELGS